ncbi:hypothetical protein G7B40_008905 [Aetokthonos hydrillicola Thurmond2011]|jgi:hypothetical protein|uniref:Uncharacterized protein n=1 Tax=Aetokthonos hydrillicola Thurmond2011 TaxID=2712845 RepID=A0AAP5I7J5_9CYAN|nr:hypothetical protein [Aetokthonos hydrillicola]MBW4587907.1 hypothetical protein [Aetokthonos hydrillicola CCALA 1050]MDR9894688.1 hypothetical protein [Aetokthonos hydrillicola Thurmond2011]
MATDNKQASNLWHKVQQNSVVWGSLTLWVFGLFVVLLMITKFANS